MQRRRLRRLQRRSLLLTECFRVFGFSAQRPALGRIRLWQRVRTVFLPECGALCPVRIPVGRLQYAVRTRADFGRPFRPAGCGRSGDSGGTGRVSSARSGGGALRFRSERLRYIRYIRGRFALFRPPVGGAPLPRGGESREIDYIYRCFGLRRDVSDGETI